MAMRIGINGFGRIGRLAFRAIYQRYPDLEVVAVNDPGGAQTDALLLEHDSNYGAFPGTIESIPGAIFVRGRKMRVFRQRDWTALPWHQARADIIIESSGVGTNRQDAEKHLFAGAKKVLITAPAKGEDITIVLGVNEKHYNPAKHHIVSNASCTTNGLAPVVKVIYDEFGIEYGFMTTIHSYTNSQRIVDRAAKDPREARAAGLNIIPTSTGAARAVALVIPELAGRFDGMAFRVPTPTVSVVDFVCDLGRDVTAEEINETLRQAALGSLKGILSVCDKPLVSMDFKGNSNSSIVDSLSTMVLGKKGRKAKIIVWYDNEWGYACRVADLAYLLATLIQKPSQVENSSMVAGTPAPVL